MSAPQFKTSAKYPQYMPLNFGLENQRAALADNTAYNRSDADFAGRHGDIVQAEDLFSNSVLQDQKGDSTLMPAIQSEFMRSGLQGALGAFGDTPGTLTPGSAGEAGVARNLGLDIASFQDRNRRNREQSLGLAEQIFPRRQIGLTGQDEAAVDIMNNTNQNNWNQARYQDKVSQDIAKYQGHVASYNQKIAQNNAGAAADSSQQSAEISGVAAIAGIALLALMCWVGREVYGTESGKWLVFKMWMLDNSPRWLLRFYLRHGERVANWISGREWIKIILRAVMNRAIASKESAWAC